MTQQKHQLRQGLADRSAKIAKTSTRPANIKKDAINFWPSVSTVSEKSENV